MELSALFFVLAILILVGMYLYAPFIALRRRQNTDQDSETSSLLAERERIISALQELDFDYKLGKIPDEDYPSQRTELIQRGAEVLRQIDDLQPAAGMARADARQRLERAAAVRLINGEQTVAPAVTDDDLESMIAARRKQRREKSAGFCPRCGQPVLTVDRFCPACGKSLS